MWIEWERAAGQTGRQVVQGEVVGAGQQERARFSFKESHDSRQQCEDPMGSGGVGAGLEVVRGCSVEGCVGQEGRLVR